MIRSLPPRVKGGAIMRVNDDENVSQKIDTFCVQIGQHSVIPGFVRARLSAGRG